MRMNATRSRLVIKPYQMHCRKSGFFNALPDYMVERSRVQRREKKSDLIMEKSGREKNTLKSLTQTMLHV